MRFETVGQLENLLGQWNISGFWVSLISRSAVSVMILIAAGLSWWLTVKVVYGLLKKAAKRTRSSWDDELLKQGFLKQLALLIPILIVRILAPSFFDNSWNLLSIVLKTLDISIIAVLTLAVSKFLSYGNHLYNRRQDSRQRPVKGIIQALQVVVITAGVIIAFSEITGKPVNGLMAGLGAVSAVTMIIFQEPLKGLVAGFQISSNDMVRIGDWIELPSQGADGEVIDISLLNVTVRNWDKTYVTFPIQSLTNSGFKNWRGMTDSGGRRIKRSVRIDMSSIRFLSESEIQRLESISLLREYIGTRREEILKWNLERHEDRNISPVNGRALTNIGVFRAYARAYVSSLPNTNRDLTLIVRQLQSDAEGLPIEIYMFSSNQEWAVYESIQSDIFDHLLAILPEFGLKAFQNFNGVILQPTDRNT